MFASDWYVECTNLTLLQASVCSHLVAYVLQGKYSASAMPVMRRLRTICAIAAVYGICFVSAIAMAILAARKNGLGMRPDPRKCKHLG